MKEQKKEPEKKDNVQFRMNLCRAEIETICKKYGLALVVTFEYRPQGIVPSLNLVEIYGTPTVQPPA